MVVNSEGTMTHSLLFFLLYPLVTLSISTASTKRCHHEQSIALLDFKQLFSFNSSASHYCVESYPKMVSWKEGTDCCSWDGVTCDSATGYVIGLDLSCSWLHGIIHSNCSLFLLSHLEWLNLAINDFNHSQIASQFGRFASLTHLNLSYSGFSGHIPSEISHLSNLVLLDLSHNRDGSTGASLLRLDTPNLKRLVQNLTEIRQLNLGAVDMFSGEPGSLMNLSFSLTSLSLVACGLHGKFPDNIFCLPNLRTLELRDNNDLTGYFRKVNWSSPLVTLDLRNTSFSGELPESIGNLTSLKYLDLSYCNFSGSIPASLGKLTQISYLSFSSNNFRGLISAWLGNLMQISHLSLSSNNFNGQIPSSLLKLEQLSYLDLSANRFSGHFSFPGVEQLALKNFYFLDLHSNLLQGPLPVPPLTTTFYDISNNTFTGEIPSLICNVSSLKILDLSRNNLSGMIPQCFGNFAKNLSVLDLRMNSFHGTIPGTFAKGNALRNLNFNGNKLEGPVPKSLVNCTKLEVLDLGNNCINDTFPYWLETLQELQVLALRSNRFHGPIRDFEAKLSFPKLRIFDLSDNSFSGPLPSRYIENLKAMMYAYEDEIEPKYMGESYCQDSVIVTIKGREIVLEKILTIFTTIDLSNNRFQGEIPKSIGKLYSLHVLNFSHNNLIGYIPSSLENLRNLESLDLSSNNLTGEIPGQLTSLTFLAFLNLSQNHLVGPIPRGKQFNTFQNDSYNGNKGLCGIPLSKKCSLDEAPQPPSTLIFQEEDDLGSASKFEWKAVLMGYGFGTVFGMVMGYLILLTGKLEWLVRIVEGRLHKKVKKSNKSAHRHGGRRN